MDWECIFPQSNAYDVENAMMNCLLLTPPCSPIKALQSIAEFLRVNI